MQFKNLELEGIFSIQNYHVSVLNSVSLVGQIILGQIQTHLSGVQTRPFLREGIQGIKAKKNAKGVKEDNKSM